MTNSELRQKSFALRKDIVEMIYQAKAGHIGGALSVCDILNVLYNKHMNVTPANFTAPEHDRFILSKGHSVEALYAVLADKGFFPRQELLDTFYRYGTKYIGHPTISVNGVEMCTGSLGHGLPVGCGMALAAKRDGASYRTYVVMGDGELAEGSIWEGAMFASHYKLDNLTAVIDRNGLQISGTTEYVMAHENLADRWAAFGWNVIVANGNDIDALDAAFDAAKSCKGKPSVIIANTTKGSGVSFMEGQPGWHHRVPTAEEYTLAMDELSKGGERNE